MSPDKTPAERLAEAFTACNDAAYTEAFKVGLDAIDRFASEIVGDRKASRRQVTAIRGAYLALSSGARVAAEMQMRHGRYEPALLSYARAEALRVLAKERCEETRRRLGGAPPVALPVVPEVEHCHADRDGDCRHANCPQLRDGEPAKSKRSCPLPDWEES